MEDGDVAWAEDAERSDPRPGPGSRRSLVRRAVYVVADVLAAAVATVVCGGSATGGVLFAVAVTLIDLADRRSVHRLALSALDDLPALALRGLLVTGAVTVAGLPVAGPGMPGARQDAEWLVTALAFALFAAVGRSIGYAGLRRLHIAGRLTTTALVVGAGSMGRRIVRRLQDHPEYGIVPLGYADNTARPPSVLPGMLLGDVTDLPKLIARHGVHQVFVAFGRMRDTDLVDLIRACDRFDCEIFVVPRLFELGVSPSLSSDHLWGVPLIRLHQAAFRARTSRAKRAADIALAALALVLTAPVMLAIALALRLEVGPHVIFRQTRIGLDGRPFPLLKFRTLRPREGGMPEFCVIDPDRIGPVGLFVRRSSLDELPQLWNVLGGQMSMVGPRPEQPHYARRFARSYPRYRERLRAPAGVTGLAQVHDLRGATPIEDRVCFDNFYIEHWSLWQDIKILARTVASVIGMRGR